MDDRESGDAAGMSAPFRWQRRTPRVCWCSFKMASASVRSRLSTATADAGWEGNLNVKWLHRLQVTAMPANARDETSHYTMLQTDGKARQFNFLMPVKSTITRPPPDDHARAAITKSPALPGRPWPDHQSRSLDRWRQELDDAEMPGRCCAGADALPHALEWDGKPPPSSAVL